MALFTDADMQDFADLGADLALKDDCEILRETAGSPDPSGGHPTTWPVAATVKCAVVDDVSPQLQATAQQKARRVPKKILLPRATNVLETDRLRTGGVTYSITGIADPTSYEVFRRVNVTVLPLQGSAP